MKQLFIYMFGLAVMIAGCTNSGSEKAGQKSSAEKKQEKPETLIDLSSSTDIKQLIAQDWEHKEDAEDAAAAGGGGSLETLYRGFSFFVDGSVTENPRDRIRFGKWTFDDENKIIQLQFTDGSKTQHKIGAIGPREMILLNTADKTKTAYRADAKVQEVPANDPFHPSNNQWRIKPKKPESDSAINERTKQAIMFYAKYLNDNAARGGNIISFTGLPACFKWYKGGISVVGKDKLENGWINCFYNKEQAIKGQQLIDKIITKKYKWDKDETNWVRQSADVVRQMYDTLR